VEGRREAAEVAQLCTRVSSRTPITIGGRLTLQICRLLLPEHCAHFADTRSQGYLQIVRHDFLALVDVALLLRLAHHGLYPLDGLLAALETPCDVLGKLLDLELLSLLDVFIVEAREHVLLVQLVETPRLLGDVRKVLGDLVLHVEPSRRQQVHLNHGIAVVLVGACGHEALPLFGHAPAVAEAVCAGSAISRLRLRVVRVRLAVGDEAVELRQRELARVSVSLPPTDWCGPATCWVGEPQWRSLMVDWYSAGSRSW
jgi:hypothetical protein